MKKLFPPAMAVILVIIALFAAGCGREVPAEDGGRLTVVASIFPPYDFARQIAGEEAEVTMLLRPGEEVHSYEPTPMDIRRIRECDLFIYTGGENDVWVDRILETMGEEGPRTLRLVDVVETYEEEIVEGMQEEREEHGDHSHVHSGDSSEEEHEEADEHVWTSPRNAALITEAICEQMCALDPEHAAAYTERAAAYEAEIEALDHAFRETVASGVRNTIIFGDRFPLRYFAEAYGLHYYAAFPGCASESEPSASTMAFLIDKARKEQLPVVFSIEFSNGNIARAIAESSGAVQRTFHTCHNVTREEFERGETYVTLMRGNIAVLQEALQ